MLNNLLFRFILLIAFVLSKVTPIILRWIGCLLGTIIYYTASKRREIGIKNLSLCFPEMSKKQKDDIIRKHFRYLVTAGLEYGLVFFGSKNKIKSMVKINNLPQLTEYYQKQPIILLAPHFIGLELGAARLSIEMDLCSIYSQQKNEYFSEKLKASRIRFMSDKGGMLYNRKEGLRSIIKHMKKTNTPFYYLPDQDFGEKDSIYVPFFNQQSCSTVTTLAKLVKLTGAIVIPMATYRIDNHYEINFGNPLVYEDSETEYDNAIKMNRAIEVMITEHIEQYFWLHKRFKTQPGSRNKLYQLSNNPP